MIFELFNWPEGFEEILNERDILVEYEFEEEHIIVEVKLRDKDGEVESVTHLLSHDELEWFEDACRQNEIEEHKYDFWDRGADMAYERDAAEAFKREYIHNGIELIKQMERLK